MFLCCILLSWHWNVQNQFNEICELVLERDMWYKLFPFLALACFFRGKNWHFCDQYRNCTVITKLDWLIVLIFLCSCRNKCYSFLFFCLMVTILVTVWPKFHGETKWMWLPMQVNMMDILTTCSKCTICCSLGKITFSKRWLYLIQ